MIAYVKEIKKKKKHRKGTTKATPKIEKICILYIYGRIFALPAIQCMW